MKWIFSGIVICIFISNLSCTERQKNEQAVVYGLIDANLKGFDPINASDRYSIRMVSQVYEGLYHYHYLKRPLQLQPQLAEGFPEISADGLTYKIKIKKGLRFQDSEVFPGGKGREVTAHDFIYSWKRLADPKNKSQGWWVLDGRILGLEKWRTDLKQGKATYDTAVEGLQALDKYTLQIKLKKVFYQFPHLLSTSYTKVVAKEAVEKYGPEFLNHPVGTGPYKLESWVRNSTITLVKNPNYRDVFYPKEAMPEDNGTGILEDAGKKLPLNNKVIVREITERQSIWLSFMQGNLDHAVIFKDAFDKFVQDGKLTSDVQAKGIKVHIEPRLGFTFEALNMEHPIFGKHKKVRQAIAMAFDHQVWIKTFYKGRAIRAHGPIPPGITGYDPNFKNPYSYNPEKAKQLLAEAGFPKGKGIPVIQFELPSNASRSRQQAEFIKQQLSEIGIRVKLVANTWPQFDQKVKTKKADYFSMGWTADYPDGENFLQLFYSKNRSPGPNGTNYKNKDYDRLYEKAMSMPSGKEKTKLYRKMAQIVAEDAPLIPMVHRTSFSPYHGWLKNFRENTIVSDFYQYLRVDNEQKAQLQKKL